MLGSATESVVFLGVSDGCYAAKQRVPIAKMFGKRCYKNHGEMVNRTCSFGSIKVNRARTDYIGDCFDPSDNFLVHSSNRPDF